MLSHNYSHCMIYMTVSGLECVCVCGWVRMYMCNAHACVGSLSLSVEYSSTACTHFGSCIVMMSLIRFNFTALALRTNTGTCIDLVYN